MPKPISTDRLYLRPVTQEDFYFFRRLQSNGEVMRQIFTGIVRTEAQTQESILNYLQLERENPLLGAWIAETRDTNCIPIGNLILRKPATRKETKGLEIGFTFLPEFWGKGFATEASLGIMKYAQAEFDLESFTALIDPANGASRAVLTKLGFKSAGFSEYVDPITGSIIPTEIFTSNGGSGKSPD